MDDFTEDEYIRWSLYGKQSKDKENVLLYDMQKRVHEWAELTFGSPTHLSPLYRRILDEVDELHFEQEFVQHTPIEQVKEDKKCMRKLADECADVLITLFRFCGVLGIDLMGEVDRKMGVNESRRWRSNGDGTGKHIKDEDMGSRRDVLL